MDVLISYKECFFYQGVEINTDYTELKFNSKWFLFLKSKSLVLYIMPFQNKLPMKI